MNMAERLGHIINGAPDPRLGNLGSPKLVDHPELWRQWYKWVSVPSTRPLVVATMVQVGIRTQYTTTRAIRWPQWVSLPLTRSWL